MNYKNDDNNYDAFVTKTIVALIFVSRDWGFGRQIRRLKTLDFRGGGGGGGGPEIKDCNNYEWVPDIWQFCERCVFWLAARNEIDDKSFRDFNIGFSRNLCRDNRIENPPGDPQERHYQDQK